MALLDRVVSVLTGIAVAMLVALTITIFADALFRGTGVPLQGARDLTSLGLAMLTLCGIPFAGRTDGLIVVDLIPEFRRQAINRARALFVRAVAFALFGVLTFQSWVRADEAGEFGEATNILEIPFQPFFYVMMIATGVYSLVLLYEMALLAAKRPIPDFGSARDRSAPVYE